MVDWVWGGGGGGRLNGGVKELISFCWLSFVDSYKSICFYFFFTTGDMRVF